MRWASETRRSAIAIEAPRATLFYDRLGHQTVQELVGDLSCGGSAESPRPDPNHCVLTTVTRASGRDALCAAAICSKILKFAHYS